MDSEALAARLEPGSDVARSGHLALVVWSGGHAVHAGAIALAFAGIVFDDEAHRQRLAARGVRIEGGHQALAAALVAGEGPAALGAMRWQGAAAALHKGERKCMVARDPRGVGGLWCARSGDDVVVATDRAACLRLLPDAEARSVPSGVVVSVDAATVQFDAIRVSDQALPFYRHLPPGVPVADAETALAGLRERLCAAFAAAARADEPWTVPAPATAVARWLAGLAGIAEHDGGQLSCTWRGCEATIGALADPPPHWQPPPSACRSQPPPEPLGGIDEQERHQRGLRATWLPDGVLDAARCEAAARGLAVCAPHLDPAVLAWLGALPAPVRAELRRRAALA
jgi:hypothetical protein